MGSWSSFGFGKKSIRSDVKETGYMALRGVVLPDLPGYKNPASFCGMCAFRVEVELHPAVPLSLFFLLILSWMDGAPSSDCGE